jgi:hypothetical protein
VAVGDAVWQGWRVRFPTSEVGFCFSFSFSFLFLSCLVISFFYFILFSCLIFRSFVFSYFHMFICSYFQNASHMNSVSSFRTMFDRRVGYINRARNFLRLMSLVHHTCVHVHVHVHVLGSWRLEVRDGMW